VTPKLACARLLGIGIAAALSATAAWSQPAAKLVITGSSTMAPLVSEMVPRFKGLHPGVEVEVRSGGSGRGIVDLRTRTSSIGMASRALLDSERDLFEFPIARDGVALIVNRDNPVRNLSARQALALVTGKIGNWKAVGGHDAPVRLIWRGKGQGTAEFLAAHFNISHDQVPAQAVVPDNEALVKEVESQMHAIAPFSVGEAERRIKAGARVRMLAFDGVAPSGKTVRSGAYALSRPLALVTRGLPGGPEKLFIDFALSAHVADLFAKYDFVAYQE